MLDAIIDGRKTIEGRLNRGKFAQYQPGDIVELRRDTRDADGILHDGDVAEIRVRVVAVRPYVSFLEMIEAEGYHIEKLILESQPGFYMPALLYMPAGEPPFPGVLVPCGHTANGKAGYQPSVLAFKRRAPIRLGEAEGVRLALVMLATQPIAKHERVRALVVGINAMSVEETYYWYSKCMGLDGNRARKALRTLLAD